MTGRSTSDYRLAAETALERAADAAAGSLERRLARETSPEIRRLALQLADLRARAARRIEGAERLFWTTKGLEQASSSALARWRAATLDGRAGPEAAVADLTAGLGIDAAALAARRPVVAVELDPETAELCRLNLGRTAPGRAVVARGDASRPPSAAALVLLDPDRRAGGRRELDPERWSPAWSTVAGLLTARAGGCVKLPPTVDREALERALPTDLVRSWSFVARGRELAEATLWTGSLAAAEHCEALRLDRQGSLEAALRGTPVEAPPSLAPGAAEAAPWIAEPHPVVLRAGLAGALLGPAAAPLGPRLGFLGPLDPTEPLPPAHAFLRRWRVRASTSADPKRVRRMLAEGGIGPVRVFVRGHPDNAATLERRFRGKGTSPGTVLVARLARGHRAYLVEEAS